MVLCPICTKYIPVIRIQPTLKVVSKKFKRQQPLHQPHTQSCKTSWATGLTRWTCAMACCLLDPYLHALIYLSLGSLAPALRSCLSLPIALGLSLSVRVPWKLGRRNQPKDMESSVFSGRQWTLKWRIGHGWLLSGEGSWTRMALEQCEARPSLKWEANICLPLPQHCSLDFVDLSVLQKISLVIVFCYAVMAI
jgi:hypothetical protein